MSGEKPCSAPDGNLALPYSEKSEKNDIAFKVGLLLRERSQIGRLPFIMKQTRGVPPHR